MFRGLKGLVCMAIFLQQLSSCKRKWSLPGIAMHLFKTTFQWKK